MLPMMGIASEQLQEAINKWGRVDALVNNAGTTKFVWDHGNLGGY